jgi:hypothetical protein
MVSENEIKNQIAISETKAKQMEYWDGEPDLEYHNGYVRALYWVLGLIGAKYNKEDI